MWAAGGVTSPGADTYAERNGARRPLSSGKAVVHLASRLLPTFSSQNVLQ